MSWLVLLIVAVVVVGWWVWPADQQREGEPADSPAVRAVPAAPAEGEAPRVAAPAVPVAQPALASTAATPEIVERARSRVAAAQEALKKKDPIAARTSFNHALGKGLPADQEARIRNRLRELALETIFSPGHVPGDPLTGRYVIQRGDTLVKIGERFKITDNLLARVNGITDKNTIRAGQVIKVIHGPFHAVVFKTQFRMEVYLQDLLVGEYSVGLGSDDGTPTGQWRIKDKLINPTYYPPRGGNVIAADDPNNPLGERWLGLEGISGEAKGQLRYGIHGTVEPESIGRNVSLGCIRLHNKDVEMLFDLLVVNDSVVTVRR
jgi:lipoprotein-anchoring transpeptidase ErfK/SrfK